MRVSDFPHRFAIEYFPGHIQREKGLHDDHIIQRERNKNMLHYSPPDTLHPTLRVQEKARRQWVLPNRFAPSIAKVDASLNLYGKPNPCRRKDGAGIAKVGLGTLANKECALIWRLVGVR